MMLKNVLLALAAIMLTLFVAYYFGNKGNTEQLKLLKKLKWLSYQKIVSIDVMQRNKSGKKVRIDAPLTISEIKDLFSKTDKQIVGGHNIPTGEWIISIKLDNGSVEELLATSYSEYKFNKKAVYLLEPYNEKKIASKPVRVPNLERFLRQ